MPITNTLSLLRASHTTSDRIPAVTCCNNHRAFPCPHPCPCPRSFPIRFDCCRFLFCFTKPPCLCGADYPPWSEVNPNNYWKHRNKLFRHQRNIPQPSKRDTYPINTKCEHIIFHKTNIKYKPFNKTASPHLLHIINLFVNRPKSRRNFIIQTTNKSAAGNAIAFRHKQKRIHRLSIHEILALVWWLLPVLKHIPKYNIIHFRCVVVGGFSRSRIHFTYPSPHLSPLSSPPVSREFRSASGAHSQSGKHFSSARRVSSTCCCRVEYVAARAAQQRLATVTNRVGRSRLMSRVSCQ